MSDIKNSNPSFGGYTFSELVEIGKSNPEKLEELRIEWTENAIASAPEEYQQRLKGLQFEAMKKVEHIKNPLSRAAFMSNWALTRLQDTQEVIETGSDPLKSKELAKVLPIMKK